MKRAAPSQEPLDVSSGDSSGSDSDQLGGKDKGGSASKAAAGAEDVKRVVLHKESQDVSSDDDLSSDSDDDAGKGNAWNAFGLPNSSKAASTAEARSKKKKTGVDFSALSRHGYHGGPSVLTVRPAAEEPNWSWSTGKDRDGREDAPESYEERERTRAAVTEGEKFIGLQNAPPNQLLLEKDRKEKDASFSQKEKRKRDRGQASRGKNYVEEEKRLLRGSGVYSGFDT
uniref:Uncharacterized protein n=1 Tax=Zea mays TaxID=4577 RepID=B6T992_MAIZE|nr:hypothetical protein [Zea mays]|eukprot:NP_001143632.1 uncharacterized protein LOC100276351 [Zea mays]